MTKRVTISTLDNMKASGDKFVMITAYDATFAKLASEAGADTILVGDSLGMVLQGHETTIPGVAGCHGLPHGVRGQG
jgi:3-methyl-2-oxobutanoate hydroxymethyltransferase